MTPLSCLLTAHHLRAASWAAVVSFHHKSKLTCPSGLSPATASEHSSTAYRKSLLSACNKWLVAAHSLCIVSGVSGLPQDLQAARGLDQPARGAERIPCTLRRDEEAAVSSRHTKLAARTLAWAQTQAGCHQLKPHAQLTVSWTRCTQQKLTGSAEDRK